MKVPQPRYSDWKTIDFGGAPEDTAIYQYDPYANGALAHEPDALDAYKGKWVNVAYLHDGRFKYGTRTFDLEAEAKAHADDVLADKLAPFIVFADGSLHAIADVSYVIQMPAGE
jgi:hypothetical protein